jgi:hypothetical protein
MMRRILALGLVMVLCATAPLSAQINDERVAPDNIVKLPMERPIVEYVLAAFFLVGAIGIGVFTSKRTHDT